MSVEKNITMRQFNGTDYDTLYPKTDVKQVKNLTPSSIGAVAKSGDTMTGNLTIQNASHTDVNLKNTGSGSATKIRNSAHRTQIMSQEDDNNYRVLTLHDKSVTTNPADILKITQVEGGVEKVTYDVLHTGNAQSLGFPKIAIGSYVGTGTSDPIGGTKQNSLTFDFKPKMLAVVADGGNMFFPGFLIVRGQTFSNGIGSFSGGNVGFALHITWSENTVSWWSSNTIDVGTKYPQMNAENTTYRYVALG